MKEKGKILYIVLKGKWFRKIAAGEKKIDFRRADDPRWQKKLIGRQYDFICLKLGYPKNGDTDKILWRRYAGYRKVIITHEEFGNIPTEVFAIDVSQEYDDMLCSFCGRPFTEQEIDARIWEHEERCPRSEDPDLDVDCDCSIELHDYCLDGWRQTGTLSKPAP